MSLILKSGTTAKIIPTELTYPHWEKEIHFQSDLGWGHVSSQDSRPVKVAVFHPNKCPIETGSKRPSKDGGSRKSKARDEVEVDG